MELSDEKVLQFLASAETLKLATESMARMELKFDKVINMISGREDHYQEGILFRMNRLEKLYESCDGCNGHQAADIKAIAETMNKILTAAKTQADENAGAKKALHGGIFIKPPSWWKTIAWPMIKTIVKNPWAWLIGGSLATGGTVAWNWKTIERVWQIIRERLANG